MNRHTDNKKMDNLYRYGLESIVNCHLFGQAITSSFFSRLVSDLTIILLEKALSSQCRVTCESIFGVADADVMSEINIKIFLKDMSSFYKLSIIK